MKFIFGIISLSFILTGCYQTTLAPMIGPAATASHGNLAYSAASTGLSYGIKHKTGKFPIEHFIKQEKEKVVKKIDLIETEIRNKATSIKNTAQSKGVKVKERWVLHLKEIKTVKQKDAFPANKPKYSYWSK